jgi:putative peptidyl-prolyl cis-trans isomerase
MINKTQIILFFFLLTPLFGDTLSKEQGWFEADKIVAYVNIQPILKSQLDERIKIEKARNTSRNTFEIVDSFINDQLLYQAADRESIIISDKKVDSHIEEMMEFYGSKSQQAFIKQIEEEQNVPFSIYREELRKKLIMEQLMVYAMDFVPPTEGEAKEWYEVNKERLLEVRFQHILIKPKDNSFTEEKNANIVIENLRERILGGESFGRLAQQFSDDKTSAGNNGIIGWTSFATVDKNIVNYVYSMNRPNEITPVFKTQQGYHIIKYIGRRYRPYEDIRDRIFQMISQQARMEQFEAWVVNQRNNSEIVVLIPGYDEYARNKKSNQP